jgi:hypothetical protein
LAFKTKEKKIDDFAKKNSFFLSKPQKTGRDSLNQSSVRREKKLLPKNNHLLRWERKIRANKN